MTETPLDCVDVRALLLEADTDELRGRGDSALAIHVQGCNACQALSQRIVEQQLALSTALAAMAAGVAVSADPAVARSEIVARRKRRQVMWRVAAPIVAAAAGGVALFSAMEPNREPVPYVGAPEWAQPMVLGADGTVVTAGTDQRVAVLPTQNPNITVVWFIK